MQALEGICLRWIFFLGLHISAEVPKENCYSKGQNQAKRNKEGKLTSVYPRAALSVLASKLLPGNVEYMSRQASSHNCSCLFPTHYCMECRALFRHLENSRKKMLFRAGSLRLRLFWRPAYEPQVGEDRPCEKPCPTLSVMRNEMGCSASCQKKISPLTLWYPDSCHSLFLGS